MSSPLENRFQKTSLGKDQTPYLARKKPGKEATSGIGDHKEMPEVRTAFWVSRSKDRDRTQATRRPFQVVLNLLLKTALRSELLSFSEAIRPMYGNRSEDKFLFCCLLYERKDVVSSQDIQDSVLGGD